MPGDERAAHKCPECGWRTVARPPFPGPGFEPPGRNVLTDPPSEGDEVLVLLPTGNRMASFFEIRQVTRTTRHEMERWLRDIGGGHSVGLWWPLPQWRAPS